MPFKQVRQRVNKIIEVCLNPEFDCVMLFGRECDYCYELVLDILPQWKAKNGKWKVFDFHPLLSFQDILSRGEVGGELCLA